MSGNVKLYYLLFIHFLIYTAFLYIQNSTIYNKIFLVYNKQITNSILIVIEGVSVLLGGILAAFIIPAISLLMISFVSLFIGISIFEVLFGIIHNSNSLWFLLALIFFSVFVGLFRFIFLVIILDQNESKFIERKIYGWFITINISYIFVFAIIPTPTETNHFITISFVCSVAGIILFIIGKYWKLFVIDSQIISFFKVIKGFKGKRGNVDVFNSLEDKNAIISISTSAIFFLLLIPIGICDSQSRYAYQYQSYFFKIPTNPNKDPLWFMVFSPISVIVFSSILLCVKIFNRHKSKKMSNIKLKIIVGIILLIISSFLSGVVEYIRLEILLNYNGYTKYPYGCILNQTIGGKTYNASCLSIYIMIPQNVINGISEVLILSACVKYLYKQSIKSIKYLSISLILAAYGSGGLSDIFFIVLPYVSGFNRDKLNENDMRLDHIYYFLGGIALFSLVIGIILMKVFPNRFSTNLPECFFQSASAINDDSLQSSLINTDDNIGDLNDNNS